MKKDVILKIILSVLLLVVAILSVVVYKLVIEDKKEPINVYLFWGDGCPHCEHAKEFF